MSVVSVDDKNLPVDEHVVIKRCCQCLSVDEITFGQKPLNAGLKVC
jgi:hypothetical protein